MASKEGRALCGAVASRGGHDVTGVRACSYICALRHLITLLYITHHFSGINEEGCAFRRRRHYRGGKERKEKRKNQLVFSYSLSLYPWFSLLRNALKHTLFKFTFKTGKWLWRVGVFVIVCVEWQPRATVGSQRHRQSCEQAPWLLFTLFYNSPSPRTNLYVRLGRLSLSFLYQKEKSELSRPYLVVLGTVAFCNARRVCARFIVRTSLCSQIRSHL